jgi:protocatechuate 3,4-dioxygenase beta subunit
MKSRLIPFAVIALLQCLHSCTEVRTQSLECDNPDADIRCCFENMTPYLTSSMIIADIGESDKTLVITGKILNADDVPEKDAILYAYRTDSKGYYSKSGKETGVRKWHGQFHGWCRTGSAGEYSIRTIRPAPYPGGSQPAHIHAAVKTADGRMRWINDFVFSDDSLVTGHYSETSKEKSYGELVHLSKNSGHGWTGKRDIILSD